LDETPKTRGRPATGRTPDAERKRKSRANIVDADGKHVSLELSAEATVRLAVICLVEQKTEKQAIEDALVAYARKLG
jgi:hypothetical protein